MNLSWLEDFLALASTGNFSRAAAARHMTQPAFSRRIRALERWLGVVLVDRGSHPARLTETGEWLRTVAQQILARVASVPDEARAVADASAATLRFAATHALSLTFLPAWLRGLESKVAVGPIQLVSDVMQQCETLMLQGRVQFMLGHAHPQVPGRLPLADYPHVAVGRDTIVPVAAPDKAGRPRFRLGRGDSAPPLLAYSAESGIGRVISTLRGEVAECSGVDPVFTAHLATVLRTMAIDGRGVAWLPASLIADDLRQGALVAAAPATWSIDLEIRLTRSAATLPAVAERFWRAVA